jgi:hypothetical protein
MSAIRKLQNSYRLDYLIYISLDFGCFLKVKNPSDKGLPVGLY